MTSLITPSTTVADLVDFWLDRLRTEGRLENTTISEYERVLRKLVIPPLGDVTLAELTTERINVILARLGTLSTNRQRKAKVVTGAMLDYAVTENAIESNPVRGSLSVSRPRTAPRQLTLAEFDVARAAVRAWLTKDRSGPKSSGDLADIIDLMLGTGARIGEVLALRWSDIDLDAATIEINATIKTESAKGTYRKTLPASRTVRLAPFAVDMLRRRRHADQQNGIAAVFATRNGTWHQVNNVERRWRQVRSEAGLDWVTPDNFRSPAL
jgi:integrase